MLNSKDRAIVKNLVTKLILLLQDSTVGAPPQIRLELLLENGTIKLGEVNC